jgi:hypothetical protein
LFPPYTRQLPSIKVAHWHRASAHIHRPFSRQVDLFCPCVLVVGLLVASKPREYKKNKNKKYLSRLHVKISIATYYYYFWQFAESTYCRNSRSEMSSIRQTQNLSELRIRHYKLVFSSQIFLAFDALLSRTECFTTGPSVSPPH